MKQASTKKSVRVARTGYPQRCEVSRDCFERHPSKELPWSAAGQPQTHLAPHSFSEISFGRSDEKVATLNVAVDHQ